MGGFLMARYSMGDINEYTGAFNGDLFESEEQVRQYFTVANIEAMFGECSLTQEELDEMAETVITNRWHMALPVDEYLTTYIDHQGTAHEAIQLPWSVVRSILGREYRGTDEDDALLIERLLQSGAPAWVRDAEGWVDEHGWGLIGPEVTGAGEVSV